MVMDAFRVVIPIVVTPHTLDKKLNLFNNTRTHANALNQIDMSNQNTSKIMNQRVRLSQFKRLRRLLTIRQKYF